MAVYTEIAEDELGRFLDGFELGSAVAFKGIAEGVSNSNYLLETTVGRYILTVYEPARSNEADLPYFLGLMGWLKDHGFPSARPIPDRAGATLGRVAGKPAAIVEFLPGLSVRKPSREQRFAAGAGLAWMHQAAQGFPGRRDNNLGQAHWAEMFAPLRARAEELKPGLAGAILADLDHLRRRWPQGLPSGAIHADFFPDNVFFKGPEFVAAIDFYFACDGAFAYDVAVALNAWCFEPDGSFNLTAARAFLAGYESRRPLGQAEKDALPVLAHGAAMRFFLTRLQDWKPVEPGQLVKPHDPLEYERKLAVHREGVHLFDSAQ
jgi:homoserine kinase type II